VDALWERQAYAPELSGESHDAGSDIFREERRSTRLSFADWLGPDLRGELGVALDEWNGRGTYASLDGAMDVRWKGDRIAIEASGSIWRGLEREDLFARTALHTFWWSSGPQMYNSWEGVIGVVHAAPGSPLSLWSGAGTGTGRDPLLRAHPLLHEGVVQRRVFGRTLQHVTIERRIWPWELGPLRLGWALFVDTARAFGGTAAASPWEADAGFGLRLRDGPDGSELRLDAARGLRDGHAAVSIGWRSS
jgi:hypothetical protein